MDPAEVQAQSALIRARIVTAVQSAISGFTQHLVLVIKNNPTGDITTILHRPDIDGALKSALAQARSAASAGVVLAAKLAGDQSGVYQQSIASDVNAAYDAARTQIISAVTAAYNGVPQHQFTPGADAPGSTPLVDTAQARATAVHQALTQQGAQLAVRNGLSVNVAASQGHTQSVLDEAQQRYAAGEDIWLEWRSRKRPGVTCPWCWALDGHRVRPAMEFPHPQAIGRRHPPHLYQGTLFGPPLHPNCQCWLVIVTGSAAPSAPSELPPEQHQYISSVQIAQMPDQQYSGLLAFLHAALHELGQLLRRLMSG